jgi:excisionase family DNA binding protein
MSDQEQTERPYTATSLADAAGVSVQYVARLCRQGKIPAQKIGPVWLIAPEDGRQWLERRRKP